MFWMEVLWFIYVPQNGNVKLMVLNACFFFHLVKHVVIDIERRDAAFSLKIDLLTK